MSKLFHSQNRSNGSSYQWSQVSATGLPSIRDGAYGFSVGSKHYICCGWISGDTRYKDFYQSNSLSGTSWSALSDIPNCTPRHTVASFITGGAAYFVGADPQAYSIEGVQKDSHKFNGTSWNEQAADCGIDERTLMGAAYHNGEFFLIGGQRRYNYDLGNWNNVLKSTNDIVSFSSVTTHPFDGGNLWGSLVSFNGKLWKIGGGQYWDSPLSNRTHPVAIYSSTSGSSWTNEGNFPGVGRQYHQTIVFDGKIWVIGGSNTTESNWNLRDVWFSSDGISWTQQGTPPWINRHAHSCWVANGALWMFGGSSGTGASGGSQVNELWKMTITA
jgi:N-acetylneuraminic acid mutarotase